LLIVSNDVVDTKMAGQGCVTMARALSDLDVNPGYSSETTLVPVFVWCAIGKNVQAVCKCWWKTVTVALISGYMVRKISLSTAYINTR